MFAIKKVVIENIVEWEQDGLDDAPKKGTQREQDGLDGGGKVMRKLYNTPIIYNTFKTKTSSSL